MGKLGKVSWIVPRRANAEKVSGVSIKSSPRFLRNIVPQTFIYTNEIDLDSLSFLLGYFN